MIGSWTVRLALVASLVGCGDDGAAATGGGSDAAGVVATGGTAGLTGGEGDGASPIAAAESATDGPGPASGGSGGSDGNTTTDRSGHGVGDTSCTYRGNACVAETVHEADGIRALRVSDRWLVMRQASELWVLDLQDSSAVVKVLGSPSGVISGMAMWNDSLVYLDTSLLQVVDLVDPSATERELAAGLYTGTLVMHQDDVYVSSSEGYTSRIAYAGGELEALDDIFVNPLAVDAEGVFGIAISNSIYVFDAVSGVPMILASTYSDELVGSMARFDGDYYVTFSESGLVQVTPDGDLQTVGTDYTDVTKLWVDAAGLYINDTRDSVGLGIQLWASGASDPVQISASPTGDTSAATIRTNATHVYWLERGDARSSRVLRAPKCGCP